MKKGVKQQEKRCDNCYETDESAHQIQKQIAKQKAENDSLVRQLKQLGEDSKKIIENLVIQKPQQPQSKPDQQEEVNRKSLEIAKKQLETMEKRIKGLEKKEEEHTFEETFEMIKQINSELEKNKQKNYDLKKIQREQDKILASEKKIITPNEKRKEIESLMGRVSIEQKSFQKKTENKEKLLKRMDEIELKHTEVCQKVGVAPLPRPDFTAPVELSGQASPTKAAVESAKPESLNLKRKIKSEQAKTPQTERISTKQVLQVKENIGRVNKSIASFEKSHFQTMVDLQTKESTLLSQKEELEGELETLSQECQKAQAVLKELQGIPRDSVLEQSQIKSLITESQPQPILDESLPIPVDSKTLLSNKNKFKRELHGVKLISDHSVLWADYNTLSGDRNYKMTGVKFYYKELEIFRVEIEYTLSSGESQISIQPPNSDEIINEKDIKVIDIRLGRNEYFVEISGLHDTTRITLLKIKTSQYKEYQIGLTRFAIKQKEFKFSIQHIEKPISIFGCFDISKTSGRLVLAQLGIEIMKKEVLGEQKKQSIPNRSSVGRQQNNNDSLYNSQNFESSPVGA